MTELAPLFRPKSVAIVGASDKNPWTSYVMQGLEKVSFNGPVHLVNRRGTPALGRATNLSCTELGGVDAAFVAVPAVALSDAIEDMAAGGVRYGAVVSSGFAEVGSAGQHEQDRIFEKARQFGLKLLGPNSLGFSNFVDGVSLSAIPIKLPVLRRPRIGLVSQSGATSALIYAFAHQQNVGLTYSIATGNEAMIDFSEVISFLVGDAETKAIAVFAETIRDPLRFEAAARAAAAARKPIVILKVGAGEITATVAQAHTGALVGDDRVFQAVCDALNIVRVKSIEDLVVTADLLAGTGPIDAAKGAAFISISGGACEIIADRCEEVGIPLPQFSAETKAQLAGVQADYGAAHNPLDLTGAVLAKPEIYSGAMSAIAQDLQVGLIGVLAEFPAAAKDSSPSNLAGLREISVGVRGARQPTVVIQQMMKPISDHARSLIEANGFDVVTGGMDHAVRAMGHLYAWSAKAGSVQPHPRPRPPVNSAARPQTEQEAIAYLGSAGVPVIPQHVAVTREDAVAVARSMTGPVAMKIHSPDVQHKSDVGGVLLDLSGDEAVGDGFDRILASVSAAMPAARIEGVLVSPMRHGGIELIVGIACDPTWGLSLAVGLGGLWVEVLKDSCLALPPISPADAKHMLSRLKSFTLLTGYRGAKPADLDRLSCVIAAIGDAALRLGDELQALEVNPLRVDGDQVEALDALAIWRSK